MWLLCSHTVISMSKLSLKLVFCKLNWYVYNMNCTHPEKIQKQYIYLVIFFVGFVQ